MKRAEFVLGRNLHRVSIIKRVSRTHVIALVRAPKQTQARAGCDRCATSRHSAANLVCTGNMAGARSPFQAHRMLYSIVTGDAVGRFHIHEQLQSGPNGIQLVRARCLPFI